MTWQTQLQALGKLETDVPLASRTTLGVGGHARWVFRPFEQKALVEAMVLIPSSITILPLGRGSNVLIADKSIDVLVMDLSDVDDLHINGNSIEAGAGVRMSKLAQTAATSALSGLEFMATVPGDLGGGIAMNAGAFGQQVSDVLVSVLILERSGVLQTLRREQLSMSYRYTTLPQDCLVLAATFKLTQGETEHIRQQMREMRKQRSESQPLALPNCGSVFKNPEGNFAAKLIEGAGLKGKKIGHARISDVHANFIVNEGGASAEDILALIRLAILEVKKKSNIDLEPEVRFVGCTL